MKGRAGSAGDRPFRGTSETTVTSVLLILQAALIARAYSRQARLPADSSHQRCCPPQWLLPASGRSPLTRNWTIGNQQRGFPPPHPPNCSGSTVCSLTTRCALQCTCPNLPCQKRLLHHCLLTVFLLFTADAAAHLRAFAKAAAEPHNQEEQQASSHTEFPVPQGSREQAAPCHTIVLYSLHLLDLLQLLHHPSYLDKHLRTLLRAVTCGFIQLITDNGHVQEYAFQNPELCETHGLQEKEGIQWGWEGGKEEGSWWRRKHGREPQRAAARQERERGSWEAARPAPRHGGSSSVPCPRRSQPGFRCRVSTHPQGPTFLPRPLSSPASPLRAHSLLPQAVLGQCCPLAPSYPSPIVTRPLWCHRRPGHTAVPPAQPRASW
ncbi:uncharacterized protein LOC136017464 [Lathamus discolor]|uniref:uncharacterized protein LOC136017464 n=1 Tax=Lathamus discolor TaxID=678569 RepID=UPI0032B79951